MAKWSVAQRARGVTDSAVDRAFADGAILRTHILRPTWHFVLPADIRWLLALSAPRVHALNASYYRKAELDRGLFARSEAALARALKRRHLTRTELAVVLDRVGIRASGLRLAYILMHAELEAVICSGAPRGKQQTYASFDERVPPAKPLHRDEALAELTARYFTSRGPATVKDFARWCSLTVSDARAGVEMVAAAAPARGGRRPDVLVCCVVRAWRGHVAGGGSGPGLRRMHHVLQREQGRPSSARGGR